MCLINLLSRRAGAMRYEISALDDHSCYKHQSGCRRHAAGMMIEKYRGLDLNLFIVFDALLKHGSVSRAARSLGRSQSAISHALGRLRVHFGDELFVKTQEGVMPTQRALEMSEAVQTFVSHADTALMRAVPFDPQTAKRRINLALNDTGELTTLVPLADALRMEAPGCTLYSVPQSGEELEKALAAGRLDLAVGRSQNLSANILQQRLYDHAFSLIVARDCPLQGPVTPDQYSAMKEVVHISPPGIRYSLADHLDRLGVKGKVAVTAHHALVVPYIVASSPDYIAIVPRRLAHVYGEPFGLKTLRTTFPLPKIEIFQYFHRRVKNDPFSIWLRKLVHRTFNQMSDLHFENGE